MNDDLVQRTEPPPIGGLSGASWHRQYCSPLLDMARTLLRQAAGSYPRARKQEERIFISVSYSPQTAKLHC